MPVVLVQVGTEDGVSEIRLQLCEVCLEEEKETQDWFDLHGVNHKWMIFLQKQKQGMETSPLEIINPYVSGQICSLIHSTMCALPDK